VVFQISNVGIPKMSEPHTTSMIVLARVYSTKVLMSRKLATRLL